MIAIFQPVFFPGSGIVDIGMFGLGRHDDRFAIRMKVTFSAYIFWSCGVIVKVDSTFERRPRD